MTRPFGSRPKLLRPSAKDAFRRDPLPGPSTRGIRARDEATGDGTEGEGHAAGGHEQAVLWHGKFPKAGDFDETGSKSKRGRRVRRWRRRIRVVMIP